MKLEKLSNGKYKKYIIVVLVISIFGVIFINKSKAKYRVTQSIQIVNGTVNYKVPDLNVLALYKQKVEGNTDESNYESITNVPSGKYVVNTDKSYCTIVGNDTKLKNKMTYNNGEISININKKGTKCYVYLDIKNGISGTELLAGLKVNSPSEGCPAYEDTPSITSAESIRSLLCKGIDDFGDTYYYRGAVTNNWVKLGNFYWRIIRINGNGTIRLIYSGSGSPATSGTNTQTSTSAYNSSYNDAKYAKYMYDNYATSSTIKQVLDNWYDKNLKIYKDKLDGTAGFCNDADYGTVDDSFQMYKPNDRLGLTKEEPTFKCGTPTTNLYTTNGGTTGNQKLTNPIGLISIDEACYAGGFTNFSVPNKGYYLYTDSDYWTMSPYFLTGGNVFMYLIDNVGNLNETWDKFGSDAIIGVRPVINLKADTTFKEGGNGTSTSPYEVII